MYKGLFKADVVLQTHKSGYKHVIKALLVLIRRTEINAIKK